MTILLTANPVGRVRDRTIWNTSLSPDRNLQDRSLPRLTDPVSTQLEKIALHQVTNLEANQELPLTLAAYREKGEAGHGNLIIEDGSTIQGYIADMPESFEIKANQTETRHCKAINHDNETGDPAIVCVGSDNQIPKDGDVDLVATGNEWYKIRSGTAIVGKDPETGNPSVYPDGVKIKPYLGVHPSSSWNPEKGVWDNLSNSGSVVHKVNDNPLPWSSPPKSLQPAQYLNRLNNEAELGPLPVSPPEIPPTDGKAVDE